MDRNTRRSTLWIVVMFNIAFADILSFITPGVLEEMMTGVAGGIKITQGLLLVFAVLLELPIIMIFLSRTLIGAAHRWANTVAAVVTMVFVASGGSVYPHYIFFAGVEVACLLIIICSVWTQVDSPGLAKTA